MALFLNQFLNLVHSGVATPYMSTYMSMEGIRHSVALFTFFVLCLLHNSHSGVATPYMSMEGFCRGVGSLMHGSL